MANRSRNRSSGLDPETFLAWFPVVMRYGALIGVLHQAVWENFDRPYLLAVYGAMMGLGELAAAVREQRTNGKDGKDE
jgi:hypothetical protein